jgi:hypothetical protein
MIFIHRMLTEKNGRRRKIWKEVAEGSEEGGQTEENKNKKKRKKNNKRKQRLYVQMSHVYKNKNSFNEMNAVCQTRLLTKYFLFKKRRDRKKEKRF